MQVMDVNRGFHGIVTKFVSLAECDAALDAPPAIQMLKALG